MAANQLRVGRALAAALCLLIAPATALPAKPAPVTLFDQADFVLSEERRPPGDDAAWRVVSLPDQWRERMPDGVLASGWYRIRFAFAQNPSQLYAVGVTHPRAFRTDFFINGKPVGGAGDLIAGRRAGPPAPAFGTPLYITVPPALVRTGENSIHVRIAATSAGTHMHGLPRVAFGETSGVRQAYQVAVETGFAAQRTFFVMALTCGLITFSLWLARRNDKVLFWYSVACLTWGLASVPRLALRWVDAFEPLIPFLMWFLNYGLVVPVVILCLRTNKLVWTRFEAALWMFLAVEASFPLWGMTGRWGHAWDIANTVLLLAGVAILLVHAERPIRWTLRLQAAALLVMTALMFFEVMRYLGWIYVDLKAVRHYHVPLMLLAIGAVIFERHVQAVRHSMRATRKLERRVAERTRAIEADYGRMEQADREQAVARQRQRILADLHEGLGASLLGLLRQVQASESRHAHMAARLREALVEMRIAVDALQPREGDLASVLAGLRQRLDEVTRPAGVRLSWEVEGLPPITGLRPATVFELQRILLEAIANVLKHSGARQVFFSASAPSGREVRIEIADDGAGVAAPQASGLGIRNMRARAARIGATLELRQHPSGGTIVELVFPVDPAPSLGLVSTLATAP